MIFYLQSVSDVLFIFLVSSLLTILYSIYEHKHLRITFLVLFCSIFLHELAHKAVASAFGYVSFIETNLSLTYIFMTIFFLFLFGALVPPPIYTYIFGRAVNGGIRYWYVSPHSVHDIFSNILISLAGPLINMLLCILGYIVIKYKLYDTDTEQHLFKLLFYTNLYLFIINLCPFLSGSDGQQAFSMIQILMKLLVFH